MKKLISMLLAVVMLVSVLTITGAAASKYSDVDGHWGQTYVEYYSEKGVVNGYPDGTFRPDDRITRAEAAQVLKNYFNFTGEGKGFIDVFPTDWYYNAVLTAQQNGAFEGYEDGSFRPQSNISREEVIVLLRRITTAEENMELGKHFVDYDEVCQWAKGSVGALREVGVLDGYEETPGTFYVRVHRLITRAEFVKLLFTIERSSNVDWDIPGTPVQPDEPVTPDNPPAGGGDLPPADPTFYTLKVKLWDKAVPTKMVERVVATATNYITGTTPVLAEVAKFLTEDVTSDNEGEFERVFDDHYANVELKKMLTAYASAVASSPAAFNAYVDAMTVTKAGVADTKLQTAVKADITADFDTIGAGVWDIEFIVPGNSKTYVVTLTIGLV